MTTRTTVMNRQYLAGLTFKEGAERVTIQLECEAGAAGKARRFVREQLAVWGLPESGDFNDRVVLTVSELVTNAVLHARTRPPGESELIGIALAFKPDQVLGVLVTDNSRKLPSISVRPPAEATHGRGLFLVNELADDWTAAPRQSPGQGKEVWAFFRCPMTADLPQSA